MAELSRLEDEVAQLLQQIPTVGTNAAQLELLQRAQEIALNRDPSGAQHRLLHVAVPFLQTLLHQQNSHLVAAILQFLAEASRRDLLFFHDLFEAVTTVLLLSFSTEKNVIRAIDLATSAMVDAFQFVAVGASAHPVEQIVELWRRVSAAIDHTAELVSSTPILQATFAGAANENNNRSAAVFLRAWKLLERAVLLLQEAKDATVFRDPARSNVQPDTVSVDLVSAGHPVLDRDQLVAQGDALVRRQMDRLLKPTAGVAPLTRREMCVAINSLSLVAAMRPQLIAVVVPCLIACHAPSFSGATDRAVQSTLKANLVKLLSHPSSQDLADEVTECLIALGDGERAFRAISKSKDPKNRRKYVSAPTEASLRRARIGKRTAEQISESVEQQQHDQAKRVRVHGKEAPASPGSDAQDHRITHDGLVNMASTAVVNLVLDGFASDLPPPPSNVSLLLTPSELKSRMASLFAKLATPSSALALEISLRRSRDPRRRREIAASDNHQQQQPSLVPILDEEAVDEMSDWVSKNATTVEEPIVSLAEDNSVQVFLKPVSAIWCRDMASAALTRILENEYGASLRGDNALREALVCRLASSAWFLLTDDRNAAIHASTDLNSDTKLPPVYQTILDFVLDDVERRASLATALLQHEYVRVTTEIVGPAYAEQEQEQEQSVDALPADLPIGPPKMGDALYRKAIDYLLTALVQNLDMSSTSDKKLFGSIITTLPRVTVDVFRCVASLFTGTHKSAGGVVLGITVLRDLIKERKSCEPSALRVLLRFTSDRDETSRNSSIRCVANQLYVLDALKQPIEDYAVHLVKSIEDKDTDQEMEVVAADETALDHPINGSDDVSMEADEATDTTSDDHGPGSASRRSSWLRSRITALQADERAHTSELLAYALDLDRTSCGLDNPLDNELEILRRLELYLALCAKKPALLAHLVATYGRACDLARQVIFQAIEKLIKHLKQRTNGSSQVVAQLHGFDGASLGLVCHIIQILATRQTTSSGSSSSKAEAELLTQVMALWQAHETIPDAISVLIPVISSIPKDTLLPLLPALLSLPQNRWTVALTRVFDAMPPQVLTPIDLLVALHHVDLKADPGIQKKIIVAINFCMEHRHAFPAEVLLHVCRVLLQEVQISKLALRTLILSVTAFPSLQQDAAHLLAMLVDRHVWEMQQEGDALWKGFVKCAALIQPASFPVLLDSTKLPVSQLQAVLDDEPVLRSLMHKYVTSEECPPGLVVDEAVRAMLAVGAKEKTHEDDAVETGEEHEEVEDVEGDAGPTSVKEEQG